MKTSQAGIKLIEQFEGLRLSTYFDSVGIATIGYGSTYTNYATGARVQPGMVITPNQAEQMLIDGLTPTESYIAQVVTVSYSQSMNDAMVSLVYNIGQGNFAKSSVLRLLNLSDYNSAADAFLLWNRAGGMVQPGLVRRRSLERQLFLQGVNDLNAAVALPLPVPPVSDVVLPDPTDNSDQSS